MNSTADALIRRMVEISNVRDKVDTLTGPVRSHAEDAMRAVNLSVATQVTALQRYAGHLRKLDQQLREADSVTAAGPVFEQIRGLMASTVEDELENPRLSDAVELTSATSDAIRATVQEAAADLQLLRGVSSPSLPKLWAELVAGLSWPSG